MFRASSVSIIRSYLLYTRQLIHFMQVMWPIPSRVRLELSFGYLMHLVGCFIAYEAYYDARLLDHKVLIIMSIKKTVTNSYPVPDACKFQQNFYSTKCIWHSAFRGPCIVIYSYNKRQQDTLLLNFILVKISTCFGQTFCPSSGVLIPYSQQLVFVILVMLTVC